MDVLGIPTEGVWTPSYSLGLLGGHVGGTGCGHSVAIEPTMGLAPPYEVGALWLAPCATD